MLNNLIGRSETSYLQFIDSAIGKISRTALLAAYIAKLGIRHAKGTSGLGKTL